MDKEQPINRRVSIVIPVYNSSKTLPKCLDSMIAQTYKDLEIICVNDCSKDNSLEIIKEYQLKDSRVKLINHKENMNAGGARNSGIRAATGTYICFVDNDDWMVPDAIDILINVSENCSIDIVAPDWCEWFSDDKYINHSNLLLNVTKEENCKHALLYGCRILGCLIRRSLFFKQNLFYPERTFWEDNAIGCSLLYSANNIKAVRRVLYYYYVMAGSSSRSFNLKKTADRIKTTQLSYDNMKRLGLVSVENKELVNYRILCLSYYTIRMLAINASREAQELLKSVIRVVDVMVPNETLKKKHPFIYFNVNHPHFAYFFWSLAYKLKMKR